MNPGSRFRLFRAARFLLGCLLSQALQGAEPAGQPIGIVLTDRTTPVSFHREVLPVLQANCLPCHNRTRAKADLILETPEAMLRGGDSGPALVPGKPDQSSVLLAAAHRLEDSAMPPAGNKANARDLTGEELGLLSLWISQGAVADADPVAALEWQAIPGHVVTSFAVALSADGRQAAVARANRISLHDARTGGITARLSDPTLGNASQRDWVNALAFHPGGELLAAAGYREVRLWRRDPVTVEPAWTLPPGSVWTLAAGSPDGRQVAGVTADGRLDVRLVGDGKRLGVWPLEAAAPVRLAWSGDGRWLAAGGANGHVQVADLEALALWSPLSVGGAVDRLAWFDQGRQLAVAVDGSGVIGTWTRSGSPVSASPWEPGPARPAGPGPIVDLVTEAGPEGALVSATADGRILRWLPDPAVAPREARVEGGLVRLVSTGSGSRFVALLGSGGATGVGFGDAVPPAGKLGGDPRILERLAAEEAELSLSRLELTRAGTLASEAEGAAKTAGETLAKAREKRDADAKAAKEKETALAQQQEAETVSTKERDTLAAELQRAVDAARDAAQALEEGRVLARAAGAADAAAQVAAAVAGRLRAELDRLAAGLPAGEVGDAAVRTRQAAEAAGTEAAARSVESAAAQAAAEKAREELAARAFAAGQRKSEADRAQAEIPPRRQQAEERLAAAQKAIPGLQTQVDKARITLNGSTQDVGLAEAAGARAASALASAKAAQETAAGRIAAAETRLADLRSGLERAARAPVGAVAATPAGDAVLLLGADGVGSRWDIDPETASATFDWTDGVPLSVTALGQHAFLVVVPDRAFRLDTRREWTLVRTLGGAGTEGFADRVTALAFSPDGELLATGGGEPSRGGELKLWRADTGELVRDLGAVHSDCVMAIAFSPRGDRLATGGADRFGRITPVSGEGPRITLEGHTHHVLSVAWLADASVVATGGADGVVKLWNPLTGERRKNVDGLGREVTGLRPVGWNREFIAVSTGAQGRVFGGDGGDAVRPLEGVPAFVQAMDISRDGTRMVGSGDDGVLRVWSPATGKLERTVEPEPGR